jgi:hypothetical protein
MFLTKALPALTRRPQDTAAAPPQPEAAGRTPVAVLVPRWVRALRLLLATALVLGGAGLPQATAQTSPPTFLVSGVIMALGPSPVVRGLGTVTIGTASGPFTFLVTAQTVIVRDGRAATYGSLRRGDFCKAAVTWNGTVWVATQISDSSNVAAARAAMTRAAMPGTRKR